METTVIYARYATAQTEQWTEGQINVCNEYAQKNNLLVIDTYIDRGMSGLSDSRPEFNRLMDDAKKGGFKYVLVYSFDRFSRSLIDSASYKQTLAGYGVKVLSALEPYGDEGNKLYDTFVRVFTEKCRLQHSARVRKGIADKKQKEREDT